MTDSRQRRKKKPAGLDRMTVDYPLRVVRRPDGRNRQASATDSARHAGDAVPKGDGTQLGAAIMVQLLARREDPNHPAARAADLNPGGEQLKHYWLHGEGAVKWSTFTELYHHLVKHMSPPRAKRIAAQWFHERYGFWPGADLNRVKHGKPPRGDVVGPG